MLKEKYFYLKAFFLREAAKGTMLIMSIIILLKPTSIALS
jgi:hypothetical protein